MESEVILLPNKTLLSVGCVIKKVSLHVLLEHLSGRGSERCEMSGFVHLVPPRRIAAQSIIECQIKSALQRESWLARV